MRGLVILALPFALAAAPVLAQAPLARTTLAPATLDKADAQAAFRAAGFKKLGNQWRACDDPGTPGYTPGEISEVRDLNGDGRPEAIVTEGSTYCYGSTEVGYVIVSKQANASWKRIADGPGIVHVLKTKGAGGWPDLEIGGPGFCFPVERWNGSAYVLHRHQYQGKACKPRR